MTLLFEAVELKRVEHSSARLLNEPKVELELGSFLSVNEQSPALIEPGRARLANYPIRFTHLVRIYKLLLFFVSRTLLKYRDSILIFDKI